MSNFVKALLSMFMVCILLTGLAIGYAESEKYMPGTYSATAKGFGGDVTVTVVVNENSIISVTVEADKETQGVGSRAVDELPSVITEANGTDVDVVGGATITSSAILQATTAALKDAGFSEENSNTMKAGKYAGIGSGYSDDVVVVVELSDSAILDIDVVKNGGTVNFAPDAVKIMSQRILDNQTVGVDTVSGATACTSGVRAAVTDCLKQASAPDPFFAPVEKPSVQKEETITTDVVVVGSGMSGCAAALGAREAGAQVIMFEKLDMFGGTTRASGGAVMAVNSPLNKDMGYEPKQLADFWSMRADGAASMDVLNNIAARSGDMVEWIMNMGVEYTLGTADGVADSEGNKYYWSHRPGGNKTADADSAGGVTVVSALYNTFLEEGGTVMLSTPVTELITDDEGNVIGVKAESDDCKYTVYANGGVCLCTGGFDHNPEYMKEYAGEYATFMSLGANVGDTGDAITFGKAVGADFAFNNCAQDAAPTLIVKPKYNLRADGIKIKNANPYVAVTDEGIRFRNEYGAFEKNAMHDTGRTKFYSIFDAANLPENIVKMFDETVQAHLMYKGDSFEELAENAGIPVDTFVATMEKYNADAKAGVDTVFERTKMLVPLEQGPFYAVQNCETHMGTIGGLKIDGNSEVLNTEGKPIKGLYAAGEAANGEFYGKKYTSGGSSLVMCLAMGKTAGESAAMAAK